MIYEFTSFKEFQEKLAQEKLIEDVSDLTTLNMNFYEGYDEFMIVNFKNFSGIETNNIMILSNKDNYVYSGIKWTNYLKSYEKVLKDPDGESTVLFLVVSEKVLENYNECIKKIHSILSEIDEKTIKRYDINVDALEDQAMLLRQVTNLVEDFKEIVVSIKDSKFSFVNSSIAEYDFDVVAAKTQHLLDRCMSLRRYITDLKYDKDVASTSQLNKNMEKLTRIMAILTIIANVIAIPNTVATLYGVSKIAEHSSTTTILMLFFASTLVSILISMYIWKKWGFTKK
ncbi:MAG: hypothetical protein JXA60_05100 [Candidatus Coatesbacteria bacterium]|nr:hypothetical protein [Candidatus Coatesbacteria bacterium]